MNDERTEKYIEEAIGVIAETLIESRSEYAKSFMGQSNENVGAHMDVMASSDWVAESIRTSHTQDKAKRTKKLFKRVVGVAAVLVLSIGLVVSVSAEARKWLYKPILEDQGEYYVVVYGPEDKEAPVYKEFIVTYVPEGYELTYREASIEGENNAMLYERYLNNDKPLYIEIVPIEGGGLYVDNETTASKEVEFDGVEGRYFFGEGYSFLMWSDGQYSYFIYGDLSAEVYIKISRGIRGVHR